MTWFVDTSALYALLAEDDPNHERAVRFWDEVPPEEPLLTHNYILVEALALVQRRLGMEAAGDLIELVQPISTFFVDKAIHEAALSGVLGAQMRQLSIVDMVSFEVMRRGGIRRAFAFDDHFARFGFELQPH